MFGHLVCSRGNGGSYVEGLSDGNMQKGVSDGISQMSSTSAMCRELA